MKPMLNRRRFLKGTAVAAASLSVAEMRADEKPALLQGKPTRTEPFPVWPVFDRAEEQALLGTLRTGKWFRGSGRNVNEFEQAYARFTGAEYCVATSSGTGALLASLTALGVGAGDEVILPPYTFVACVNAILMLNALPVFVDTDPETFQIDALKIEPAITERTAAIMPVHLGGNAADLDTILAIARKHRVAVVEDACQAHLAEWRHRKLGTYGDTGCFSFQASKNLTGGEGGAILTASPELAERCFAAQNNSFPRKFGEAPPERIRGANLRMSEFHAALLMAQMKRVEQQSRIRDENGAYLTGMLQEIPGITPARSYDGCTRNAYHLYMFRYRKEHFADLPRKKFLQALSAEGIPASSGYTSLNNEPFIAETLQRRPFRKAISGERLSQWHEQNLCPANDELCAEAVWFSQNLLLADRTAMEQISGAIRKIQRHAAELAEA